MSRKSKSFLALFLALAVIVAEFSFTPGTIYAGEISGEANQEPVPESEESNYEEESDDLEEEIDHSEEEPDSTEHDLSSIETNDFENDDDTKEVEENKEQEEVENSDTEPKSDAAMFSMEDENEDATASEEDWKELKEEFHAILADHDLNALIYNCDQYDVRTEPKLDSSMISSLQTGYQVRLTGIEIVDHKVWYQVEYAVKDIVNIGYVENENIITSDMFFMEWKEKYNVDSLTVSKARAISSTNGTDLSAFPASYRASIQALMKKYPNWTFVPFNTGLNWNTVIENEMYPTRNLVPLNSMTSWKSTKPADYNSTTNKWVEHSGGGWVQASESIVKYYMDPRNFLNETSVFQFEMLTYSTQHTESGVEAILNNTFMSRKPLEDGSGGGKTYAKVFMEVGKSLKVSPYFLAGRIRQEQGVHGTSKLISGTYPGFEGLYNYFNMGAFGNTNEQVIVNGLTEARNEGWTSRYLALQGGATKTANKYIRRGQDTLYLQKFDVDDSYDGLYWHQYMQNLLAADNEGKSTRNAYSTMGVLTNSFVFKVPVYQNMPANAYPMPKDTLAQPKISAKSNGLNAVTISWNEISGATGYKLYRASSENGTYSLIKTISSVGTTSYKDTVSTGQKNYYKVRAYMDVYGGPIYSKYSSVVGITAAVPPTTVSNFKLMTLSSAQLTWKKVSGVTGYRIYRKTGKNGSYKMIKNITSASTTTYLDKTLIPNKTYYYKMRAYTTVGSRNYYSSYTKEIGISTVMKKITLKSVKVDKYSTSKITWNKTGGVTGYCVYRKVGSGSFKLIKTLKGSGSTSYVDKGVVPNRTYTYRVRSYKDVGGKKYYSAYSKQIKVSTAMKKVNLKKVKLVNYSSNVISWGKTGGITGYRVYRKEGKGSFKLIKTIKGSGTLTYTDKAIKPNKTYTYRVRGYKDRKGKRYYSPYSKQIKVNVTVKPTKVKQVKKTNSTVQLSLSKVGGVTGYRVYKKTSNGKYQLVKVLKGSGNLSFKDKNLKGENIYRVRAFKTSNKKNYYSKYSKAVSFTF